MTFKKRILLPIACTILLVGCGEDFTAGVVKGGSGNGKPNSEIDIVVQKVPLNESYSVWLSKPQTDYCQGIKRTLQFLNPITFDVINEDQLLEISPFDEIENQLILQVHWENKSNQPKKILHPSCNYLIELAELGAEAPMRVMSCDVDEIAALNVNDVYIHQQMYKFDSTSRGELKHSISTQFLPREPSELDCEKLNITYEIQNIDNLDK